MPNTTTYEFGDVVLVPFPFTDQSTHKRRPAVVVSSATYNTSRPDLIILAITSQVRSELLVGEAPVRGWKDAGLIKPSVFKPLLATVDKSRVLRRLGRLQPNDSKVLGEVLATILGAGT